MVVPSVPLVSFSLLRKLELVLNFSGDMFPLCGFRHPLLAREPASCYSETVRKVSPLHCPIRKLCRDTSNKRPAVYLQRVDFVHLKLLSRKTLKRRIFSENRDNKDE